MGTLEELLFRATSFADHIAQVNASRNMVQRVDCAQPRWCPPDVNWVKINTDGAASSRGNIATAGGLARNVHGIWLSGFQRSLGCCSALDAELWAILHGLQLTLICGDCTVAINMIKAQQAGETMSTLIRQIALASLDLEQVSFEFTKKEANWFAKSCDCLERPSHY